MESTKFFPGVTRRVILSTITLQKDRRIKLNNVRMPLTGEAMVSMPDWISNAYTAVSQNFTEVEPEIQQIGDLSVDFSNHAPGAAPDKELFEAPLVKAPNAEIKKLTVLRTGDSEDPDVSLQFTMYMAFARKLWEWLGEMGGKEVYVSFPSSKPAVEVMPPRSEQESFLADRPELDEKYDAAFDPRVDPPELSAEYEQGVAESLGVPAHHPAKRASRRGAGVMAILLMLGGLFGSAYAQRPAATVPAPSSTPQMSDTTSGRFGVRR